MLEPESYEQLQHEVAARVRDDRALLDELRADVRPLRADSHRIQPRSATAVSLVGTDGGNTSLQFDPFLIQLVRVVDSSNNEYCLEAITPSTDPRALSARQFGADAQPRTALGRMMAYLGVQDLIQLSAVIRLDHHGKPTSPTWVQAYRELVEWATLFTIVRDKDFGSDTLIVFDGFLRSKIFARDLFARYVDGLKEGIARHAAQRRHVYIAGIAKRSKVLQRYRLAMTLENVLTTAYPAYVVVPRPLEEKTYVRTEYARGDDRVADGGTNMYVGGTMFFVKFGSHPLDPIWPIDLLTSQAHNAQKILGFMLADASNGFPVPFYPLCLQKAHENATLVDFDLDILQDHIYDALRDVLGDDAPALDAFRLLDIDPARARYG